MTRIYRLVWIPQQNIPLSSLDCLVLFTILFGNISSCFFSEGIVNTTDLISVKDKGQGLEDWNTTDSSAKDKESNTTVTSAKDKESNTTDTSAKDKESNTTDTSAKDKESNTIDTSAKDKEWIVNSSKILAQMMEDYDPSMAPFVPGKPVKVQLIIEVLAFGEVNEANMEYGLDLYFLQLWNDIRLAQGQDRRFSFSGNDIKKFWTPDTYFMNAKKTEIKDVMKDNQMVFIMPNGQVVQMSRMTLKVACHMQLHMYPFDRQKCDLVIESFNGKLNQDDQVNAVQPEKTKGRRGTKKGKRPEKKDSKPNPGEKWKCYRCNETGDIARNCPALSKTCKKCGITGHLAVCCKTKNPKCSPGGRQNGAYQVEEASER
ncbi:hypothetical protein OS493_028866 [Desmophyllum pertusum]|uniref:CCHC-type domain-containing protein n=1 Tax=Desmophyllum pertusum TaxID=174260 RepID=A0A9X0D1L4_9CNID|nr:hypothetical protein OS493_028866 [Desmophyllum pertusum]